MNHSTEDKIAALVFMFMLVGIAILGAIAWQAQTRHKDEKETTKSDLLCINKDTVSLVMRERDYIEVRDRGLFVSPQLNEPTYYYVAREGDLCIIEESQPNPLGERL